MHQIMKNEQLMGTSGEGETDEIYDKDLKSADKFVFFFSFRYFERIPRTVGRRWGTGVSMHRYGALGFDRSTQFSSA